MMLLVRFAIVGVVVALVYISLYMMLLSLGTPQIVANGVAFLVAVLLQYAGQAAFTFGKQLQSLKQISRFTLMVGLGLASTTIITGPVARIFGLSDLISAVLVTIVLPIQNFLFMRFWVFARGSQGSMQ